MIKKYLRVPSILLAVLLAACASTQVPAQATLVPTQIPSNTPNPTSTPLPTPSPTETTSPTATIPPRPNEYITIAQLNLWYNGPGCYGGFEAFDCSGKRSTALDPLLGYTYKSSDPQVIQQQIDWAAEYGVDAFSLEWTTPRTVNGSLEGNIDNAFLKSPNLDKIRWCIFYDLVLRLMQTPNLNVNLSNGMDFNQPDVYTTFVDDFDHFAQKYFNNPDYLKIDGRPVVYVWGTWNAIGNFAGAIRDARQKAAESGYDVFIVGDIIRADVFNRDLAASYDANTNFNFIVPGLPRYKDVGATVQPLDRVLGTWQNNLKGLQVNGRTDLVNLEPGFTPQFDNRLFSPSNSIYVPATSKDQVTAMAELARKYAQPVGSQGWKLVWLNTWNDWQETTTFEPTQNNGPKYPAGNYGFDMLEVIKDVFGPEVFPPY